MRGYNDEYIAPQIDLFSTVNRKCRAKTEIDLKHINQNQLIVDIFLSVFALWMLLNAIASGEQLSALILFSVIVVIYVPMVVQTIHRNRFIKSEIEHGVEIFADRVLVAGALTNKFSCLYDGLYKLYQYGYLNCYTARAFPGDIHIIIKSARSGEILAAYDLEYYYVPPEYAHYVVDISQIVI